MKRRDLLFNYGVPAVMATVALIQKSASRKFSLSPWKGGGFGMFSTVDSPAARFLRIYLVTSQGKTQVNLPSWLENLVTEVRTIPTKTRVLNLTRELAQSQWFRYTSAILQPSTLNASERGSSSDYLSDVVLETPNFINRRSEIELQIKRLTYLLPPEILEKGKSLPSGAEFVTVQEVQVEVWQYMFDHEQSQINAHKILSSNVKRLS